MGRWDHGLDGLGVWVGYTQGTLGRDLVGGGKGSYGGVIGIQGETEMVPLLSSV